MTYTAPAELGNTKPTSFDGPVLSEAGDHLNRWPFAREIYGIATTGPKNWSVRIGVYGEWGTGKTSVLKFVTNLAEKHGHIVVWFDPWEYSSKPELWRAFVRTVFEQLKAKLGNVPGANHVKAREWAEKAGGILSCITNAVNEGVGSVVEGGLDLVKKHFAAGSSDFKAVQPILGDKRIVVLIDDLDRTAPELVPEILFALKELMDIPGFSFVCAFDPVVVGEVLGKFHPGFGDGLEFLDKIIDYPRWLPPPSSESLAKLATADAKDSCPFVPGEAIAKAVPLLPANPRAVRQFIRILALLKPQVQRHYDHELRWAAIVAANILKVRHPRIAHELLGDTGFWDSIGMIGLEHRGDGDEEAKIRESIEAQIKKTCAAFGITLEPSQQNEIRVAMTALTSQTGLFGGLLGESVSYQFNIAEAPAAVTWKEFDTLIVEWKANQSAASVTTWIGRHAGVVERTELDVYRETLQAALQRYAEALSKAENVFVKADKTASIAEVNSRFALLETLVFELGNLSHPNKRIGNAELEGLVDKFVSIARSRMPVHSEFWPRNEDFLQRLFKQWSPDVTPLVRLLDPHAGGWSFRDFDEGAVGTLREKLSAIAMPRYARQLIASFREDRFTEHETTLEARRILWNLDGPLWREYRSDAFRVLKEASSNRIIQKNAYELLHWYVLEKEGQASGDRQAMERLFSDQMVFDSVWNAATATPLAPRAIYQLRNLPGMLKALKIDCSVPSWWTEAMAGFIVPAPKEATESGADSGGES